MTKPVDLHIHSIYSDGNLSPMDTVKIASQQGLAAIAIADHDDVSGIREAVKTGNELGVKVIPAVELSTRKMGISVHMLAYFIDIENKELLDFLNYMKRTRLERAQKIVHKLNAHGMDITMDDVKRHVGLGCIGRPHIAEALIEKGLAKDFREVFGKYIGDGKPCHVPKASTTPEEAIKLIIEANGIPVLAHPGFIGHEEWVPLFAKAGLMGVEAWYPNHSTKQTQAYLDLAKEYNLIPTGGSDSHGTRPEYPQIGDFTVPYEVLERLEEYAKSSKSQCKI